MNRTLKARARNGQQRMFGRELLVQERMLQERLKRFFARQNAELAQALNRGTKAKGDWFNILKRRAPDIPHEQLWEFAREVLGDLIDWDTQRVNLERLIRPLQFSGFEAGVRTAQTAYGIPAIQAPELTDHLIRQGLGRIEEISETTRRELARSIAEGIQAGDGRRALIARVQEHMTGVSEGRAAVIATTEAHTSIMSGNMEQMKRAGFKTKTWRIADNSARDSHRLLNNQTRPIDQPFSNGLMYPGDPSGPPGEIINCRCTMLAGE